MKIAWFSTGASSAVAVQLASDSIDEIIYTHIEDQHPDTLRFLADCEQWFGKPITVLQSPYATVEAACLSGGGRGYINGPQGARCTRILKRRVRKQWELARDYRGLQYTCVWGMDLKETHRAERIRASMPDQIHEFPLIDNKITKEEAHKILAANGIKRPVMYDLGYHNNNCIGCVKGGMGYWNKIRVDFPHVFAQRAAMERRVGCSCMNNGVYLDTLEPKRGRHAGPICGDCGIFCEVMAI